MTKVFQQGPKWIRLNEKDRTIECGKCKRKSNIDAAGKEYEHFAVRGFISAHKNCQKGDL
jgi:hypothetical protein